VPDERRHLRVVAPAERVRRRLTPALGVLLTAGLFALLFAVAIAHTLLVQGQIRLDAIDKDLATEQARYQTLRTEVAEMESPARVVDAAHQLGMVTPEDLVYLQPTADDAALAAEEVRGSAATLGEDGAGDTAGDHTGGSASSADDSGDDESSADTGIGSDGWPAMKPLLRAATP
jgi:cell division protein FtsL